MIEELRLQAVVGWAERTASGRKSPVDLWGAGSSGMVLVSQHFWEGSR